MNRYFDNALERITGQRIGTKCLDLNAGDDAARAARDVVEPRIRKLVVAMNRPPLIETLASCQGHLWPQQRPYVLFRCETELAAAICCGVQTVDGGVPETGGWTVRGYFDGAFRLRWLLESDPLAIACHHDLRYRIPLFRDRRDAIDEALDCLADRVGEVVRRFERRLELLAEGKGDD